MPVRRLLPLAAVAVAFALTSACTDQSAAIKLGDRTYSDANFREDLDAIAENDTMLAIFAGQLGADPSQMPATEGEATGSYNQQFVSLVLGWRLEGLLVEELLQEEGLEVSDADLDGVRGEVEAAFEQAGEKFSDLPKGFRDRLVEILTNDRALRDANVDQERIQAVVNDVVPTVEVNSRYGSFDFNGDGLMPPEGPQGGSADQLEIPAG